jgi:hypothetical protein
MPPRTEPSVRRRIARGSIALALLAATSFALARTLEFPSFDVFTVDHERRHLDPIPIDPVASCGHVAAIHTQLEDFQTRYLSAQLGIDPAVWEQIMRPTGSTPTAIVGTESASWPEVESELDASAILLDATIANGIPSFPPRIQAELTKVREQIAIGRMQLGDVDNAAALNVTSRTFEEGQLHAGYAGDLVGSQCPVQLGA